MIPVKWNFPGAADVFSPTANVNLFQVVFEVADDEVDPPVNTLT